MTITEFKKFTENRLVYLDGATGSNLMKRGMPAGVCPEKWILDHPDIFIGLQREFVEAGSDIIYAPTFTANRIKLKEYGLEGQIADINCRLAALSRQAADGQKGSGQGADGRDPGRKVLVAGDITMTGRQLVPMGDMDFEDLITVYKEQIRFLYEAGVDLLVVETMMSLQETRAAVIAAKEVCDLPVMATLTFESDGRTLYGTDSITAAVTLEKLGVCALGANCSTGPDKMLKLIQDIAGAVSVPVIAKPNAGMPGLNGEGETVYDMDAHTFGMHMKELAASGACILGGCCGTTPEYIKELADQTKDMLPVKKQARGLRYLSSERKTVAFDLDSPFMIVGERINPTGKKKLQAQLREGSLDMVVSFAEEQEMCGASLLDINVGMSGIDEKEMMLKALEEVTVAVNLPIAIDSSHVEVMEAALRRYPGRALINSISGEKEKLKELLPLAKKYGAMFILLPLSDKGLPESLEEKIGIIDQISQMALSMGMEKEDIVVDGLVATVGANPNAAKEVREPIRYCKKKGFATVCGLSNISFGLPERSFVNGAFLTMAIQEGLTMAIANPSQDLLVNTAFAADLLMNKEGSDIRYIDRITLYKEKMQSAQSLPQAQAGAGLAGTAQAPGGQTADSTVPASPDSLVQPGKADLHNGMQDSQIYQDVMKGNRKQIKEHTKAMMESGQEAASILNDMLLPAIDQVGDLFDKGKYFLPQLIASAEAMKLSIEYLEPFLARDTGAGEMPVVVIATVAGDIHDIGKNLVALMLKNHGFRIVDLGKDVPREVIAEEAVRNHARIIALSALMTTTMQEMKRVVDHVREKQINVKIMIGGAVITPEYAKEIGADGYSKDAAEAVKTAKRLLGMEAADK